MHHPPEITVVPALSGQSTRPGSGLKEGCWDGVPRSLVPHEMRDWPIWTPLLTMLLVSLCFRFVSIDQMVSAWAFDAEQQIWPLERAEPWLSFYRYGTVPPNLLGLGGLILATVASWTTSDPRIVSKRQRAGLFLGLVLLLGPGLLVNVGLKTLWGRPRPIQCTSFGGDRVFLPVGTLATQSLTNSSFPSGHAAVAFYLIAPSFLVSRSRPCLRRNLFLSGLCYGCAMGLTRILQGGHFVSDVLWAGTLVYLVSVGLAWAILPHDD